MEKITLDRKTFDIVLKIVVSIKTTLKNSSK